MKQNHQHTPFFPTTVWQWIFNAGLLLIAIATAMPLIGLDATDSFRYIYCVGAALALVGRIASPSAGERSLRVRRLIRLQTWSAIMYCAGAVFMWYTPGHTSRMDWIAFTLAGAALQIYSTMALPHAMKREANEKR